MFAIGSELWPSQVGADQPTDPVDMMTTYNTTHNVSPLSLNTNTNGYGWLTDCLNPRSVRIMGSCVLDLCYVACGRLDAMYLGVAGGGLP